MSRLDRLPAWTWLAAALGLALGLRLCTLGLPLDRDEGELMSLAWLWRAGHGLPYRDYLELKPPLGIAVYSLAESLWRDGVLALRWLALAWQLVTLALYFLLLHRAAALGRLGEPLRARPAAFAGAAALVYALLSAAARCQGLSANTEAWQALPMLAALGLLLLAPPGGPRPATALAAGLGLGLASLFKQTALAAPVFFALGLAKPARKGALAWMLAGAGLVWAGALASFALNGAAGSLLADTLAYGGAYAAYGQAGSPGRALGLARWLAPEQAGAWILALLGGLALAHSAGGKLLLAWLAWGLAALAVGGRYYPHYALPLLPPLAALAAAGLAAAWAPRPWQAGLRLLRPLGLASLALGCALTSAPAWLERDGAQLSRRLYGVESFATAPQAAAKVAEWSGPEDKVFVWGADPQLFYLARRAPASRFLYHYPFEGAAPELEQGGAELLAGLLHPATRVAVLSAPFNFDSALQRRLAEQLEEQYRVEHRLPGFVLGQRR